MANNKSVKTKKGENMTLMSINVEEIISDLIHLHKSGANDDILALCERYSPLFTAQRFNFEKKPPNGYRLFLHARGLKLAALPLRERGTTVIPVWSKLKRSNQAYYNNRALKLALLQRAIHEASSNQGLSVLTNLTESEIKMWTTQDDKAAEKFDRMEIQAFDRKTACNLKKTRRTVPIVMTPNDDDDDCDGDNYIPAASRREVINEPRRRLGRPKKEVAKGASGNAEPRSRASQRPKRMVKKRVDDAFVLVGESDDDDEEWVIDSQPPAVHPDNSDERASGEMEPSMEISQQAASDNDKETVASSCTTVAVIDKKSTNSHAGDLLSESLVLSNADNPKGGFVMFDPPHSSNLWFFLQTKKGSVWTALEDERRRIANLELPSLSVEETPPAIEASVNDVTLNSEEERDLGMLVAEESLMEYEQDSGPLTNDADWFMKSSNSVEIFTQPQAQPTCDVEQSIQNITYRLDTGETTSIDSTVHHAAYDLNCFESPVPSGDYPSPDEVFYSGSSKESDQPHVTAHNYSSASNGDLEVVDPLDMTGQDEGCYNILGQQLGEFGPIIEQMISSNNMGN